MNDFYPEGILIEKTENAYYFKSVNTLNEALYDEKIIESRAIVCDADHNLIVDMGCMKGIIPRDEGALGIKEGVVRDIAIISRVNRPVSFIVTAFTRNDNGETVAILSRRKAQQKCMDNYIRNLHTGDVINAKITHLEPFGAFADIGCGIVSLIPIDTISVSRIEHPCERFSVGMNIKAVIKNMEDGRISLTHKELLGTWEENARSFRTGETVAGIIRSVEDYGAFVELTPNLAGLAELKDGITKGCQASVYIKNIIPERMKIKLIIIDTFEQKYKPTPPVYFFNGHHIDKFIYSPECCQKTVETVFQ
ncbi:MAG: 30S ribosomal protein S1 [Clostridia bacterium]|nr:30S ribosomal protein S1 [Clostridia bacterium]